MAMNSKDLAIAINDSLGAKDSEGKAIEVTSEMETYASTIINSLIVALANNPSGTVEGITTAGSPLLNGKASEGLITGLLEDVWIANLAPGNPKAKTSALKKECSASVNYITTAATIAFAEGQITGICTSTGANPGPLSNGEGIQGTIESLVGEDWAKASSPPTGDPKLTGKLYDAIIKYINENAEITYAAGTVIGTCPPAAGPLTAGTASGGTIL